VSESGGNGPGEKQEEKKDEKIVEVYPAPEPDLPEPSLKQYFIGWGAVFLGLVALAVLLGLLMRWLR
jgi:hypothetical protein